MVAGAEVSVVVVVVVVVVEVEVIMIHKVPTPGLSSSIPQVRAMFVLMV
jgi:hypothetical protein